MALALAAGVTLVLRSRNSSTSLGVKGKDMSVKCESITPLLPSYRLTIELSDREARDFLDMTARIGGLPERTTRGLFDQIGEKLRAAGVCGAGRVYGGGITFSE
jgi:hypothetical protein